MSNEIELLKEKFAIRLPNVKIHLEKPSPGISVWALTLVFQNREIEIEWWSEENHFLVYGLPVQSTRPKRHKDSVKLFDDVVIALDDKGDW